MGQESDEALDLCALEQVDPIALLALPASGYVELQTERRVVDGALRVGWSGSEKAKREKNEEATHTQSGVGRGGGDG